MSAGISSTSDLPLEAVAKDFGNIQKDLGTNARVAALHQHKKTLVHHQYLDILDRNDVGRALMVTEQAHFTEHIPTIEFPYDPGMAVDGNLHLSLAADKHEHLVAQFTLTHNGLSVRKRFILSHQGDNLRLRRPESFEEPDCLVRIFAQLEVEQIPQSDDTRSGQQGRQQHQVIHKRRSNSQSRQEAEFLDWYEAGKEEHQKTETQRRRAIDDWFPHG